MNTKFSLWAHTVWVVATAICFVIALALFPLGWLVKIITKDKQP